MYNKTLRVADSQKTPRHVRTNLRMSSRDVRILAIKRSGGKTTLYHPSSPRLDPHDVTPQNYLEKHGIGSLAGIPRHYNRPGSDCHQNCCKLGKGTTSVQNTPPHLNSNWMPQSSVSMGLGGWVSKFYNPFVPSRQNGDQVSGLVLGAPFLNK